MFRMLEKVYLPKELGIDFYNEAIRLLGWAQIRTFFIHFNHNVLKAKAQVRYLCDISNFISKFWRCR